MLAARSAADISHNRTLASSPTVASVRPSGLKASTLTTLSCPRKVIGAADGACISQSWTVFALAAANQWSSGLNPTATTGAACWSGMPPVAFSTSVSNCLDAAGLKAPICFVIVIDSRARSNCVGLAHLDQPVPGLLIGARWQYGLAVRQGHVLLRPFAAGITHTRRILRPLKQPPPVLAATCAGSWSIWPALRPVARPPDAPAPRPGGGLLPRRRAGARLPAPAGVVLPPVRAGSPQRHAGVHIRLLQCVQGKPGVPCECFRIPQPAPLHQQVVSPPASHSKAAWRTVSRSRRLARSSSSQPRNRGQ